MTSAYCFVALLLIAGTSVLAQSQPINCEIERCNGGSVCRYVEPCAKCPVLAKCITVAEIGQSDLACKIHNYSEAILTQTENKVSYKKLDCLQGCPNISQCMYPTIDNGSCCRVNINDTSVKQKQGNCPTGSNHSCGGVLCHNDDDCPNDLKCCKGCGNRCAKPQITNTTTTTPIPGKQCGRIICQPDHNCIIKPECHDKKCEDPVACVHHSCARCKPHQICNKKNECENKSSAHYSVLSWFLIPIPFMMALYML